MNLIEVIISLFLLSLLLFSLDATQLITLKQTQGAYYFNIAQHRIEQWQNKVEEWNQWQEANQDYLPLAVSSLSEDTIIIKWGGMKGECEHSIMERVGCINVQVSP